VNQDIQELADKICDLLDDFRDAVPLGDSQKLVAIADEVDKLNEQLRNLILPAEKED